MSNANVHEQMNGKKNVAYPYNGILFKLKKEERLCTWHLSLQDLQDTGHT